MGLHDKALYERLVIADTNASPDIRLSKCGRNIPATVSPKPVFQLPTLLDIQWFPVMPDCSICQPALGARQPGEQSLWSDMIQVPFTPYESHRRQHVSRLRETIHFSVKGHQGVLLSDALEQKLDGLDGADVAVFTGCGAKISYVIKINGYSDMSIQKYAHSHRGNRAIPFCRAKVARQVAEVMSEFLTQKEQEESSGPLRLGQDYINLKHLYLLELRHVSKASFQPIFGIQRDQIPRRAILDPTFLPADDGCADNQGDRVRIDVTVPFCIAGAVGGDLVTTFELTDYPHSIHEVPAAT